MNMFMRTFMITEHTFTNTINNTQTYTQDMGWQGRGVGENTFVSDPYDVVQV